MTPVPEKHPWSRTWLGSDQILARRLARPTARFLRIEAAGGVLLLAATILALVWANSGWRAGYQALWATRAEVQVGSFHLEMTLLEVVNDGLMALFFFVVGIEIRRELSDGELRDPRAAALPVLGAIGGVVLPAAIYLALNVGTPGARGWGIPMATDIAFAVGVVALLGSRVPASLKVFLLALAVVDDLIAIVVIALFYAHGIELGWLAAVGAGLVLVVVLQRMRVWYVPVYVVAGVFIWYAAFRSGVHATVAGVALGLLVPTRSLRPTSETPAIVEQVGAGRPDAHAAPSVGEVQRVSAVMGQVIPVNERLVRSLSPWTSFVVIPVFALANAGLVLSGPTLRHAAGSAVTIGVFLGLVVGKTVGVAAATGLAVRMGWARRPRGVTGLHMLGISMAAGIGFTVAIFITGLAFPDAARQDDAKAGIFAASIVAALVSSGVLWIASGRGGAAQRQADEAEDAAFFEEAAIDGTAIDLR